MPEQSDLTPCPLMFVCNPAGVTQRFSAALALEAHEGTP
jgi:hypothetical protein